MVEYNQDCLIARLLCGGLGSSLFCTTDKWSVVQDTLDEVVEDDEDKSIHLKGIVVE